MELLNWPITVPSLVHWPEDILGVAKVLLQQTPSAVIADPPLDVTLPPAVAVVDVTFELPVVLTVGKAADVVNVTELP